MPLVQADGLKAATLDEADAGDVVGEQRGWDQVEGVIEPKSRAGWRRIPLLAVLREILADHLRRTERGGEELAFGRTATEAFYASTVDYRAKRAWRAANEREREAAEREGREPDLLRPDHPAPLPPHLRLAVDRLRGQRQGGPGVHESLEDPDDVRCLRPSAARQPRRGPRPHGRIPASRRVGRPNRIAAASTA